MGTMSDYLVSQFQTAELVLVAEYLGLAPVSDWGSRRIVDAIKRRLESDSVPTLPLEDGHEDMNVSLTRDYLYVAEYIHIDDTEELVEEGDDKDVVQSDESKPKCWSLADDMDPACNRCPVYDGCAEARVENLPPCFGVAFLSNDPECGLCIEATYCKRGRN